MRHTVGCAPNYGLTCLRHAVGCVTNCGRLDCDTQLFVLPTAVPIFCDTQLVVPPTAADLLVASSWLCSQLLTKRSLIVDETLRPKSRANRGLITDELGGLSHLHSAFSALSRRVSLNSRAPNSLPTITTQRSPFDGERIIFTDEKLRSSSISTRSLSVVERCVLN